MLWVLVKFQTASDVIFSQVAVHCPVILHCFFDRIKLEGIILWILVQSDTVKDLILLVGPCDLYS